MSVGRIAVLATAMALFFAAPNTAHAIAALDEECAIATADAITAGWAYLKAEYDGKIAINTATVTEQEAIRATLTPALKALRVAADAATAAQQITCNKAVVFRGAGPELGASEPVGPFGRPSRCGVYPNAYQPVLAPLSITSSTAYGPEGGNSGGDNYFTIPNPIAIAEATFFGTPFISPSRLPVTAITISINPCPEAYPGYNVIVLTPPTPNQPASDPPATLPPVAVAPTPPTKAATTQTASNPSTTLPPVTVAPPPPTKAATTQTASNPSATLPAVAVAPTSPTKAPTTQTASNPSATLPPVAVAPTPAKPVRDATPAIPKSPQVATLPNTLPPMAVAPTQDSQLQTADSSVPPRPTPDTADSSTVVKPKCEVNRPLLNAGDDVGATMVVSRNHSCDCGFRRSDGSLKVTSGASNGTATAKSNSCTYKPREGFTGSDSFTLQRRWPEGGQAIVTFEVTVVN